MIIKFDNKKNQIWRLDAEGVIIETNPKSDEIGGRVLNTKAVKKGKKVHFKGANGVEYTTVDVVLSTKRAPAPKNYGSADIMAWQFEEIDLPKEWQDHLGDFVEGSRFLVKGNPKNGKTEYMMQFSKMFINAGYKVNYNSIEQGKSKSFKAAYVRNKMYELPAGKFMLCEKSQRNFETWYRRLQRPNSGDVIICDSADYMGLTFEQLKMLVERFPNKTIIIVCWLVNRNIKAFEHVMDGIVEVKDFVAKPISRLGGNQPFKIWDKKPKHQPELF